MGCREIRGKLSSDEREALRRYIADAREALDQLKYLTSLSPDEVVRDKTLRYSLRYSIILLVEALTDLAVAILEKLGRTPQSYREAFMGLAEAGIVPLDVAEEMARLASLRNAIIHRYWHVDDVRVLREAAGGGVKRVEELLSILEECVGSTQVGGEANPAQDELEREE